MHRSITAAALTAAVLVPASAAQASFVDLDASSEYRIPPRSNVSYFATNGETNQVTFTNGANGALVVTDPGATINSASPACVVAADAHSATCTPAENLTPTLDVFLGDGNDTFTDSATIPSEQDVGSSFPGDTGTDDLVQTVFVAGDTGDDTLTGGTPAEQMSGGFGNDTMTGNGGDDFLGDINQQFEAPADRDPSPGNDTLVGGDGDDGLFSGDGTDNVNGGNGDDAISGGIDADTIDGGAGNDSIEYDLALFDANGDNIAAKPTDVGINVTLNSATRAATTGNGLAGENDSLANIEDVFGTQGADTIVGSAAGNVIGAGSGNDTITGAAGNDSLSGGGDNDTINAQDKEIDLVDCGGSSGSDVAAVDSIDSVRNCTTAQVNSVVVTPQPPVIIRDPADTTKAKIAKLKAKRKVKARKFRRSGKYSFRITANEDVAGEFGIEGKASRKALRSVGFVTLGTKRKVLAAGKSTKITLKVSKKFRRKLRKGKKLQVTIRLTDAGGNITSRKFKVKLT